MAKNIIYSNFFVVSTKSLMIAKFDTSLNEHFYTNKGISKHLLTQNLAYLSLVCCVSLKSGESGQLEIKVMFLRNWKYPAQT